MNQPSLTHDNDSEIPAIFAPYVNKQPKQPRSNAINFFLCSVHVTSKDRLSQLLNAYNIKNATQEDISMLSTIKKSLHDEYENFFKKVKHHDALQKEHSISIPVLIELHNIACPPKLLTYDEHINPVIAHQTKSDRLKRAWTERIQFLQNHVTNITTHPNKYNHFNYTDITASKEHAEHAYKNVIRLLDPSANEKTVDTIFAQACDNLKKDNNEEIEQLYKRLASLDNL